METRFLRTFLAVVETSSLAEAGRRLNITPSAVNQRLRVLEDELGQPLIRRSGHSMQPTAAGVAILHDARQLLKAEDEIRAAVSTDGAVGQLRVGFIHTMLTGLLPELLASIRRNRPGIDLYVLPGMSNDLYTGVTEGRLDAAVLVRPHFVLPKSLDWSLLRREPLVLITPPDLSEDDPKRVLASQPFIRYDRNHWGGRVVDLHMRRMRVRPREGCELDSLEAITMLVSRGLGVSIVPLWPRPWPEGADVRIVELPGAPTRDVGIVWSRSSNWLPLIRGFLAEATKGAVPRRAPVEA